MKDFAVNGMNAIMGLADILAMIGLLSGTIFIVIDSLLIMKAITEKAASALKLAIIAVLTSPLIIFPLLFTMYSFYALKVSRQQKARNRKSRNIVYNHNEIGQAEDKDDSSDDVRYIRLADTDTALDEDIDDGEYIKFEDLKDLQEKENKK